VNPAPQLSSIGKYRLIATIGHGGMAHIHLALMGGVAGFNKLLVIKALREDIAATSDEFVTMFLDEARLAARLNHPNIVQTYEVGEAHGRFFIAMEYLEGQSLKTIERRLSPGGLPLTFQLRVISDIAKGLHHAHELRGFDGEHLGVVHRDVSPQNVFLTYDGHVKLLDFGIAKAANAMHLTKVGVIKGKADYIAPEQIRGEDVDCRADIFSLGVMLWEALAGRRFSGGPEVSEITKMHNRLTGSEVKLRDANPEVPERLAAICDKAIALDPKDRHANALALAQEIDDYLADASLHPSAQQLAELITPPFKKERDQLRKLIDEQMKLAMDPGTSFEATTGALPVLRSGQGSGVWMLPGGPFTSNSLTPSGITITQPGKPGQPLYHSQPVPGSAFVPPKRAAPWPFVIAALGAAAAVGTYFATRPGPDTGKASASVAPAQNPQPSPQESPADAPASAEAPKKIRLRIRAEPEGAEARLDGSRIALPFDADLDQERAVHKLEVSADGYETHREMITYDRDRTLIVALEAAASTRAGAARKRAPVSRPAVVEQETAAVATPAAPARPQNNAAAVEPGMDFRSLNPVRPGAAPDVTLEEDPYQ
jgi:serine/threonine-protein kinase